MPRKSALEGEKLDKAVQMKKNGASYGEIAEEFEISKETAYRNVKEELESQTKRPKRKTEQSKRKTNGKQTETKRPQRETKRSEEITKRRDETKRKTEIKRFKPRMERLPKSTFRKVLELFIDGKNSEQIAEKLDVPLASVEYELLPYISELKTARRLQKRFEEEVKCRI